MSKQVEGRVKTLDLEKQQFKVASSSDRIIEGFFTTKDVDREGDVSLPSAFDKTMKTYMKNPVLTFMHDIRKVMGKVLEYSIEDTGVWVKAQIAKGIDWIDKDVWPLIEQDMIKGFSYGYSVKDSEKSMKNGEQIRILKEVDVYEVAVVPVPMNASAMFTLSTAGLKSVSVKLENSEIKEEEIETAEIKELEKEGGTTIITLDEIKTLLEEKLTPLVAQIKEELTQLIDNKLASLAVKEIATVEDNPPKEDETPQKEETPPKEDEKEILEAIQQMSTTLREIVDNYHKGG